MQLVNELKIMEVEKLAITRKIGGIKSKITTKTKPIIQEYAYGRYGGKFLTKEDMDDLREYISNLKGIGKYERLTNLLKSAGVKYFTYLNMGDYPIFYITNKKGKYQLIQKSTGEVLYEGFAKNYYTESWFDNYYGRNEELNKVCPDLSKMDDWIFKEI